MTAAPSGDIFVCEDARQAVLDIAIITPDRRVTRFLQAAGPHHDGSAGGRSSELTGVAFDPTGTRMYFSSQRAHRLGATYEVTGPFHKLAATAPGIRRAVAA
jgi:hypothetical protein